MALTTFRGVVRNGKVETAQPFALPDGSEVYTVIAFLPVRRWQSPIGEFIVPKTILPVCSELWTTLALQRPILRVYNQRR